MANEPIQMSCVVIISLACLILNNPTHLLFAFYFHVLRIIVVFFFEPPITHYSHLKKGSNIFQ